MRNVTEQKGKMRRVKTWDYRFLTRDAFWGRSPCIVYITEKRTHGRKSPYWVIFCHISDWNNLCLEWRLNSKLMGSLCYETNQVCTSVRSKVTCTFPCTPEFLQAHSPQLLHHASLEAKTRYMLPGRIWPCLLYFNSGLQQGESLISSACSYSYFTYCARYSLWMVYNSYTSQNKQIFSL